MELLTKTFSPMDGVRIGHWTDESVQTGCTVVRFDAPALTAVDVRGAAPGSRELDLLQPGRTVQRSDAILLTGGSAMGLAAADGVVRWMQEHDRGFPTSAGKVPIVPAAVIFDLAVGSPTAPNSDAGYAATAATKPLPDLETGRCGAGTGATIGKIGGETARRSGGCVAAQVRLAEGLVMAIAVVNAFGSLRHNGGADPRHAVLNEQPTSTPLGESTTLMVCVTDLPLSHDALMRMTVAMHDGLARSILPVHTIADGDIAFASTTSEAPDCPVEHSLRASMAAELAVEAAIDMLRAGT